MLLDFLYKATMATKKSGFVLVRWIEHPPKWDVLPASSIVGKHLTVGSICKAKYGKTVADVEIINIGNRHVA